MEKENVLCYYNICDKKYIILTILNYINTINGVDIFER